MAPKREASQTKDTLPAKRMQSATSNQPTAMSVTTKQHKAIPEHQPCGSDVGTSSTPLTNTLPSSHASVPVRDSLPDPGPPLQMPPHDILPKDALPSSQQTSPSGSNHPNPTSARTTVTAVVPAPVLCLIDPECTSTCPEPLVRRLQMLSTYSNVDANTFALGHLLPNATWGTTTAFDDRSKLLCNPKTNEPINIWILGHISSTWFLKNGDPDNQCSVTVLLLSSNLGQYANQLVSEFSTPMLPINEFDSGLIRAVRWQSPKGGGAPILFNSIYDAWKILKSKSSMQKLDISCLEKRALILVETHLQRYRQKDEKGRWTIARAQFELQAIYLLQDPWVPEAQTSSDTGVEIAGLEI
ncbi:hypothetical protein M404DRAFT_25678 [Pisolithus tinctorius Marx 270]|uniref:Uncharacterized protein n=1 Tax=Pisolithus tinctorius Marx 270 TaxID=870435 RepID=A0A0C3PAU9_PISTI|nr:hypothetical protein M404DRAFT_25678 [Pisolithus tinctorius Marx 270]